MANTLTNLIPPFYAALNIVSRELVGLIQAVARNSNGIERAALDQIIRVPIAPAATAANNTPGVTAPDTGDQTIDNVPITIDKSKHVAVRWTGEETRGLQNAGNYNDINAQRFSQALRTLVNEIEQDIWLAGYKGSSRGFGTAGTAPFGTADDLSDAAGVARILDDNGAPLTDRHLAIGSAAMANIRGKQSVLFKVNESGTAELLRRGVIGQLMGFELHNSAAITTHTKGTGTGYLVNDATPPGIGDTSITTDTGTGTILAGDIVTLAGDSNKYVVAAAHASNTLVINKPGLRVAADDDDAITVGATYTPNIAFHRAAIQLVTRLPALPEGGDMADDRETITDPVSGISFELSMYRQYRQVHIEVALAWGVDTIMPAHVATLIG